MPGARIKILWAVRSPTTASWIGAIRMRNLRRMCVFKNPANLNWPDLSVQSGSSSIQLTVAGIKHVVAIDDKQPGYHNAGEWTVTDTGYIPITFKGIKKEGNLYGNITSLNC